MKAEELKQRRKALKMTQAELAATLSVNISTVQRWESGESKPDGEGMLELALKFLETGYGRSIKFDVRLINGPRTSANVSALGPEQAAIEFVGRLVGPSPWPVRCVVAYYEGKTSAEITVDPKKIAQWVEDNMSPPSLIKHLPIFENWMHTIEVAYADFQTAKGDLRSEKARIFVDRAKAYADVCAKRIMPTFVGEPAGTLTNDFRKRADDLINKEYELRDRYHQGVHVLLVPEF